LLDDDLSTGISNVSPNCDTENAEWYDLNGRRIVNPKLGIYINGSQHKLQLIKK